MEKNTVVFGISKDSVASHLKFATKNELPFDLLSDTGLDMIKTYGMWIEKKLYGKLGLGILRGTYVLDESGRVILAMDKVKPDRNAQDVLDFLTEYSGN